MGGYGSTRWANTPTRHCIGECLALDLARIGRSIRSGRGITTWAWTQRDGEPSIRVNIGECEILLTYTVRRGGGAAMDVRDAVALERTPCTRGGDRVWFRCPGCGRRVRALYLAPGRDHFCCRHCHGLAYASQQVAPDERHLIAMRKIRRRLGDDPRQSSAWVPPPKPKGMHWRTYERLRRALTEHEREREAILLEQMKRLLARSDRARGIRGRRQGRPMAGDLSHA
jgi:hypothetical protein